MQNHNNETQSEIASEYVSKDLTVEKTPIEFFPEILGLTAAQKHEYCSRLSQTPNAHTSAEVLSELGFRNDEGSLSFIQRHIVYDISDQDILQSWNYLYADKTDQESKDFFSKASALTNTKALKLIQPTNSERDGLPFLHSLNCYFFPYQNGVLKIKRGESLSLVPYENVRVLVNAKTILPREFQLSEETVKDEYWMRSDFYQLTLNQAKDPVTGELDTNLHESIMMALAKTCHLYFNQTDPCAVIFSEQTEIGERNAGGTGKGILVQAISQMMGNPARIDGKSFDIRYPHALQAITANTKVVWVDEVGDMEMVLNAFYTGLTDGFIINPKNRNPFTIPPERAPRVVFTTNSPGTGLNDSDLRRRYDVPITRWYNAGHQPTDDFGKELFGPKWTDEDWNMFYMTMAAACYEYLEEGYASKKMPRCAKALELLRQAAVNEIEPDLADFFDLNYGDKLEAGNLFQIISNADLDQFKRAYPANRSGITNTSIYNQNLKKWLKTKGWKLEKTGERIRVEGHQYRCVTAAPSSRTLQFSSNPINEQAVTESEQVASVTV